VQHAREKNLTFSPIGKFNGCALDSIFILKII